MPVIVDSENKELTGATEGNLCINMSWPGQMRTVFGDHQRFIDTYFSTFPEDTFLVMDVEEMKTDIIG